MRNEELLRRVITQPGFVCRGLPPPSLASIRRSICARQLEMNAEPPGFDRAALVAALREWELPITSLTYLSLGAGSHHYLARDTVGNRWFVTVDVLEWKLYGMFGPTFDPWVIPDLQSGFDGLNRAFRTAAALRDAGLEFVHAPITRPDGAVVARLGDDYAVSVFHFIEGASHSMTNPDRFRLLKAVGRLHACTDAVPADLPRRDSLTVPIRSQFFESLGALRSDWNHGPFGLSARRLLGDNESLIRELWHRCDELADEVRDTGVEWVITHGQLHSANVLRATAHAPILIDWDCVAPGTARARLGQALGWAGRTKDYRGLGRVHLGRCRRGCQSVCGRSVLAHRIAVGTLRQHRNP
jgi:spectinomycin phosphotransferase